MSSRQNPPSKNTLPRPANFNYPAFIDSVNRVTNNNSNVGSKQEYSRWIQQIPNQPISYLGGLNLTEEELRRINGPIPPVSFSYSTHVDVDEAIGMMEKLQLGPSFSAASSSSMSQQHQQILPRHGQPPPLPPKIFWPQPLPQPPRVCLQSLRPQGPRSKPLSGTLTETGSSATTTTTRAAPPPPPRPVCASDYEVPVDQFNSRHPPAVDMSFILPPLHRYPSGNAPSTGYVRSLNDLQVINRSLESWEQCGSRQRYATR
ncbi:MAG: hypothetical protein J3R72DRAFT_484905 [Linnemannia gamsii]|nr:MAG: hypothetical protein J3R72DRAFT_484905 [Linnemannia gamsii]